MYIITCNHNGQQNARIIIYIKHIILGKISYDKRHKCKWWQGTYPRIHSPPSQPTGTLCGSSHWRREPLHHLGDWEVEWGWAGKGSEIPRHFRGESGDWCGEFGCVPFWLDWLLSTWFDDDKYIILLIITNYKELNTSTIITKIKSA